MKLTPTGIRERLESLCSAINSTALPPTWGAHVFLRSDATWSLDVLRTLPSEEVVAWSRAGFHTPDLPAIHETAARMLPDGFSLELHRAGATIRFAN